MRPIKAGSGSRWQRLEKSNRGESVVATIWLVLYVLLLGAAIASPFMSDAMLLATR
ncbi:MAG TPA: hypothetical protein VGJ76_02770 [Pseudolabrys sp.]|jgi:hypothetical protein